MATLAVQVAGEADQIVAFNCALWKLMGEHGIRPDYINLNDVGADWRAERVAQAIERNAPLAGSLRSSLQADPNPLALLGLDDRIAGRLAREGYHVPGSTRRHPAVTTVGQLARLGARDLLSRYAPLHQGDVNQIQWRLEQYAAANQPPAPSRSRRVLATAR